MKLLLLILLLLSPLHAQAEEKIVTIGTAGVTGVYYPAGGAICRLVNRGRKDHGIRCFSESTEGSIDNIEQLKEGSVDLAIIQSDWLYNANKGKGIFAAEDKKFEELRTVFALHSEPFAVIVRGDSEIEKFSDIRNSVINLGPVGSGTRVTFEELMKISGIFKNDFKQVKEFDNATQAEALCNKEIDVMVFLAGQPNTETKTAASLCDVKLVDIDREILQKLVAKYPYYSLVEIPGGIYKNNKEPVKTFGTRAILAAKNDLPEDITYTITKTIFDNFDNFKTLHPVFISLQKEYTTNFYQAAPLHKGAQKYFKEVGLIAD